VHDANGKILVCGICNVLDTQWRMQVDSPRVDHLDVVGRLTPSMNGNQEYTAPQLNLFYYEYQSTHSTIISVFVIPTDEEAKK
jgi:hypothetical protein